MSRSPVSRAVLTMLAISVLALLLAGCGPRVPSEPPTLSGVIREIQQNPNGTTVLVYGAGDIERISARVDTATVILRLEDGALVPAVQNEIIPGRSADLWIDGPLAESYPAQGHAGTLLLR